MPSIYSFSFLHSAVCLPQHNIALMRPSWQTSSVRVLPSKRKLTSHYAVDGECVYSTCLLIYLPGGGFSLCDWWVAGPPTVCCLLVMACCEKHKCAKPLVWWQTSTDRCASIHRWMFFESGSFLRSPRFFKVSKGRVLRICCCYSLFRGLCGLQAARPNKRSQFYSWPWSKWQKRQPKVTCNPLTILFGTLLLLRVDINWVAYATDTCMQISMDISVVLHLWMLCNINVQNWFRSGQSGFRLSADYSRMKICGVK